MCIRLQQIESTPYPNAIKCICSTSLSDRPRSYLDAGTVGDDPLAQALFKLPGVRNLLINNDWVTIGKSPDAEWAPIRAGIEDALAHARPNPGPDADELRSSDADRA